MATKERKNETLHFRPAARHILTIGRDLIKDNSTALLELVKNSYDADASRVTIKFNKIDLKEESGLEIEVSDDGHGMSPDVVRDAWLVPSTPYKVDKVKSPVRKRVLQGRKGIGRYAASILGDQFYMRTVTAKGEETSLEIDWAAFEDAKYLEEVEVTISNSKVKESAGTTIKITGNNIQLSDWDDDQIKILIKALRRLISPIHEKDPKFDFRISIEFGDFPSNEFNQTSIPIEPLPILDVFDYRISGTVSKTGDADLVFINSLAGTDPEKISFHINLTDGARYGGELALDFKIYDRDVDSINNLINRLDKAEFGDVLSKNEARNLLTEFSGVAVYRDGFRIRPHGDPGYDWLKLDSRRVQNPGVRFGNDRLSGFVEIEDESKSHLPEKANREGLKENAYYDGLVQIIIAVLAQAETRRYQYKSKLDIKSSDKNISRKLETLFDLSAVTEDIDSKLAESGIAEAERSEIINIIDAKAEEGSRVLEDLKQVIAIYQGQATLGKIVKVLLHEGRNPISYFQNQVPILEKWIDELSKKPDKSLLEKLIERLKTIKKQSDFLAELFRKISPLATRRKSQPSKVLVSKAIEEVVQLFQDSSEKEDIEIDVNVAETEVILWPDDLTQALVNLLDNSLYWLTQGDRKGKKIVIEGREEGAFYVIDYKDTGPGIEEKYIDEDLIFEPGFSTKPNGTGLGLAIAGEAIERSKGEMSAVASNDGVHFIIKLPI